MSYTRLLYHIVFRTRDSIPAMVPEHEETLYTYIWGVVKNKKSILYRIGGMPDHLHLLIDLHPSHSLSDFMRDLKVSSNKWLQENPHFPAFCGWAESYGAFSYGLEAKESIVNYIKNQKEHHKKESFADEFRRFVVENGITIDERYFLKD